MSFLVFLLSFILGHFLITNVTLIFVMHVNAVAEKCMYLFLMVHYYYLDLSFCICSLKLDSLYIDWSFLFGKNYAIHIFRSAVKLSFAIKRMQNNCFSSFWDTVIHLLCIVSITIPCNLKSPQQSFIVLLQLQHSSNLQQHPSVQHLCILYTHTHAHTQCFISARYQQTTSLISFWI